METWQLIAKAGNTIGLMESITASEAVYQWRKKMDQLDNYFDRYYNFVVLDNNQGSGKLGVMSL